MAIVSSRSDAARRSLATRGPFRTYGALSAVDHPPAETGRLPCEWVTRYRADAAGPGVVFCVRSYATPIAWVRRDGQVVVPDEGYSVTTSRHQNLCRAWLS